MWGGQRVGEGVVANPIPDCVFALVPRLSGDRQKFSGTVHLTSPVRERVRPKQ